MADVGEEELGRAGGGETCCGLVTEGREQGRGRAGGGQICCGLVKD